MANFKRNTRYTNTTVAQNRSGKKFLPLRFNLNLPSDPTDISVQVTQELEKRPDLVSYKAYGLPDLWWVIYEYNNISDPFFNLKAGMILVIPSIDRVITAIQNLGS